MTPPALLLGDAGDRDNTVAADPTRWDTFDITSGF